jgi:hypothetical protein
VPWCASKNFKAASLPRMLQFALTPNFIPRFHRE